MRILSAAIALIAISCDGTPNFRIGRCTQVYLEDGLEEEPCNTPEVIFAAEDVLNARYSRDVVHDTMCEYSLHLHKDSRPPRHSYQYDRYNGFWDRGEVHVRLRGPDLAYTALYHEWFAHTLPKALGYGFNAGHAKEWSDLEEELTAESELLGYLYPIWCTTATVPY